MSKVDTDEGLGPGSERMRREVLEGQKKLDARSKQKEPEITPSPAPAPGKVDKTAVTQPGVGKVERRDDTVDDLLDGFGTSRPDLPRILPKADTTPPPEPIRKELTPTEPGKRQRQRNTLLMIVTFLIVAVGGIALVKMTTSNGSTAPTATAPTASAKSTATATATATTTATSTEVVSPITTMPIESLPTVKTSAPTNPSTAKSVHSAPTTTSAATTATTTTPHPTGSAPPGMNLLPDDPHR